MAPSMDADRSTWIEIGYAEKKPSNYEIYKMLKSATITGIGTVKASLEFGSNAEMEKYFFNKRMSKKVIFSKN